MSVVKKIIELLKIDRKLHRRVAYEYARNEVAEGKRMSWEILSFDEECEGFPHYELAKMVEKGTKEDKCDLTRDKYFEIVDGAIHTHNDDDANVNAYPIEDIARWVLDNDWATDDERLLQLIEENEE